MADERKILRGVRMGRELYTDVDELQEVASKEQLEELSAKGYITGFGYPGPDEAEQKPRRSSKKAAKKAATKEAAK